MKANEILQIYKEDPLVQTLASKIKPNQSLKLHLKKLAGSLDSVIVAATHTINHQNQLCILADKESAAYFFHDLQNLLPKTEIHLFPSSYKRPYQFEEVENANILMRAEILNLVNNRSSSGVIIITYPEALTEKVINRKSLTQHTYSVKIGEKIDLQFLSELLTNYDFEKTDFVYEAGQFAIRGGIIDIFSYAHDLPYRLELFGDEIDGIRTFDPSSQLSIAPVKEVNLIPNIQTKLLEEQRESFLNFLPRNTKVWVKDYQQSLDVIDDAFQKAVDGFETILQQSNQTKVILEPDKLFETSESFAQSMEPFVQIQFGQRFYHHADFEYNFEAEPQSSFDKNFELIAKDLDEHLTKGYKIILVAEVPKQLDRLSEIFVELDPDLQFQGINLSLREGFVDHQQKLLCYTDHQLFERFHKYRIPQKYRKSKALTLKELRSLQPGDYVVHIDHGIGRFAGMQKVEANGREQEAMRLVYKDNDLLFVSVHALHKISKYSGKETAPPNISKLGSQEWENKKKRAKRKVIDLARDLIELYAKRKAAVGFSYGPDDYLQTELETSFFFEDTPDQAKAVADVKEDMMMAHPMDRLVCGDVGFGKTEVAIRAAFKAAINGKQTAILVPTTILAMQHNNTFRERLANFPVRVEYINRFRSPKQVKQTLEDLAEGKVDIIIGTHRLVNRNVKFKNLGLLIIDEEQKFGVSVKEKLKELKVNVDTLTLTATPIPRTLHFSLMGARDLSIISTPPPNRQPVTTEIHHFNDTTIRDAISYELRRGGQVFFVHNRIASIDEVANIVYQLVPDARIGIAHGQMEGKNLEKVMLRFIGGEYDVLVSTNIIESGLDIPNANTIIINHAHMFGLSDLHQMRGRVGRSNKKAFCYLLSPPTVKLSSDARKRLSTLEEFSDLGAGLKVAMRDLDIRGAGNLLGREQSGFITDLGFEMYHKILDEAVKELKESEFKDLFTQELSETIKPLVQDCTIETDLELLIPEVYVANISERLSLYSQLDNIDDADQLASFTVNLKDRFGPLPDSVKDLIETVKLRWKAQALGLEKLTLKSNTMKGYFLSPDQKEYYQSDVFGYILQCVKQQPSKFRLKEIKNRLILTVNEVIGVKQAISILSKLELPANPTLKKVQNT